MTYKSFLPTIASISIGSLALSSCATISKYRKDPSEWDKSPAAESATSKKQSATKKTNNAETPQLKKAKQTIATHSNATLPIARPTKKQSGIRKQRRQVGGLLSPDADRLPNSKDLQEVHSVIPKNTNPGGVNIPVKP